MTIDRDSGSDKGVWDDQAINYDDARVNDSVYRCCLRQTVDAIPHTAVICLDAGRGTGLATAALAPRCDIVVAVDYSAESLKILAGKQMPNVLIVQADLRSLPFPDSAFDASICANTLQHLRPDGPQQAAVRELRRTTKPGGVLALSVHHYSRSKQGLGWIKEGKPGQPGIDYIFRFTRADLLALVPDGVLRGIGFYGLLRFPLLGSALQNIAARVLGRLAPVLGYGHMLTIVTRTGAPPRR